MYIKTRLVTKTCNKRDLPPAHDLYTSKRVSNITLKMTPTGSKHVAG